MVEINILDALLGQLVSQLAAALGRHRREHDRRRQLNELRQGNWAAEDLAEVRRLEFPGMSDDRWAQAQDLLVQSLQRYDVTNVSTLIGHSLYPANLKRAILDASRSAASAGLDRAVHDAFETMLEYSCRRAITLAQTDPQFDQYWKVQILRELRELRNLPPQRDRQDDPTFEQRYLEYLKRAHRFRRFELFGIGLYGRATESEVPFDEAYVPLQIERLQTGLSQPEAVPATPISPTFHDDSRVLLFGRPGAGKTTFLRHQIAATARVTASTAQPRRWEANVPFLIELRRFKGGRLPHNPDDVLRETAELIASDSPDGWAQRMFSSGRALLLLDGVDDLDEDSRSKVKSWLEELVNSFPLAKYLVSTRPAAITAHWLTACNFAEYRLTPMDWNTTESFINRWHAVADALDPVSDQARSNRIERRMRLIETLRGRPDLEHITESPLMCGLVCALNLYRDIVPPRNQAKLYDEVVKWLLLGWEGKKDDHSIPNPWSSEEQPLVLLQRLADLMVRDAVLSIDGKLAQDRLATFTRGMNIEKPSGEHLLNWLLERTGLLRVIDGDVPVDYANLAQQYQVGFAHRTFRDFLAARELVASRSHGELLKHAHESEWLDILVMAMGRSTPTERTQMLAGLLAGNEESKRSPEVREQLKLVAAACMREAGDVLDLDTGDQVRDSVLSALREYVPPRSKADSDLLASCGPLVVDLLLEPPRNYTSADIPLVVRTLAKIGSGRAVFAIGRVSALRPTGMTDQVMTGLLKDFWREAADPCEYAKHVLADHEFSERPLKVTSWREMNCLEFIRARHVECIGRGPLDSISRMAVLSDLTVVQNDLLCNLKMLCVNRGLVSLAVSGCAYLTDVSALANSSVRRFRFGMCDAIDFATLAGVRLDSLTVRDGRVKRGLGLLPTDMAITELILENRPADRNLAGIERWKSIVKLQFNGMPDPFEVELLQQLPALSEVVVLANDADDVRASLRPLAKSGVTVDCQ